MKKLLAIAALTVTDRGLCVRDHLPSGMARAGSRAQAIQSYASADDMVV